MTKTRNDLSEKGLRIIYHNLDTVLENITKLQEKLSSSKLTSYVGVNVLQTGERERVSYQVIIMLDSFDKIESYSSHTKVKNKYDKIVRKAIPNYNGTTDIRSSLPTYAHESFLDLEFLTILASVVKPEYKNPDKCAYTDKSQK